MPLIIKLGKEENVKENKATTEKKDIKNEKKWKFYAWWAKHAIVFPN